MFCHLAIIFSERNHFQTSKAKVLVSSKSTELVPLWKVHGFRQNGGGVAKDMMGLQQQLQQKEMYCIYTNQVLPYKWPASSQNDVGDKEATPKTVQQVSWSRRLMHRTRSAMM